MTDKVAAASPATEEVSEVDPSTVVVDGVATEVPDANPAAPSTVDTEDANKPASLLDVVKSAVEPPVAPEASSAPEGDEEKPNAEEAAPVAEAEAEDDANLPFHSHPRWKAVLAERDGLKEPAERWGYIESFMQQHALTAEEVAEGYEVMAQLKGGPEDLSKARDWFAAKLGALDEALGNVLPEDLQSRVDDGLLDEDGAAELAKARATAALNSERETARATATAAERERADITAKTTAMVDAVTAWETRIKASDPDYPKKEKLVLDRCLSIVRSEGNAPTTPEEATALSDRALAEINAEFKAALPKPRPITPGPTGTSTSAAAQPTTLREAINGAVGR